MLEQLAGPFTLTFEGADRAFGSTPVWLDALGFVCCIRSPGEERLMQAVCQIDGQAFVRATIPLSFHTLNLVTGGLAVYDYPIFYPEVDLRTFRPIGEGIDTVAYSGAVSGSWAVLPDRGIWSGAGRVYAWPNGAEARILETTLSAPNVNTGNAITSPTRQWGRVFFAYPNGRIFEYDWREKAVVGLQRYVPPNDWCYYSPALGVFITITRGEDLAHHLRVYADEVAATSISYPAPVGDVEPGLVVTARTLVQGDHLEPCPNRVVSWSTTVGTVLDERTATDEAGYASTRIRIAPDETAAATDVTAELIQ